MEIEYRNEDYKNKSIYKVGNVIGNVIEDDGAIYLVCQKIFSNKCTKYFLISLKTAIVSTEMYESLKELKLAVGNKNDTLVKAKLIIDYKLDGDAEDEDNE